MVESYVHRKLEDLSAEDVYLNRDPGQVDAARSGVGVVTGLAKKTAIVAEWAAKLGASLRPDARESGKVIPAAGAAQGQLC